MTKIICETVTLPAHWAVPLINGDYSGLSYGETKDIEVWQSENPHLHIVGCNDTPDLRHFDGLLCDTLQFEAIVTIDRNGYLIYPAHKFYMPLPHHKAGLSYTATGYGRKIPTPHCIYLEGRRYRIYCRIFSNIGTAYIIYRGREVIVND